MAKKSKRERKQERKRAKDQEEAQTMALLREVSDKLFDWKRMENRCLTPISAYLDLAAKLPNATVVDGTTDNPYIYIDFGASLLGVAHLDTHGKSGHFAPILVEGEQWVMCSQLDDRLGVFLLLDVLHGLGMKYDILLTTGEESGNTSAKKFRPPEGKAWNWMFECDRTKDDVVRYQYDDDEWEKMLKNVGFGPISRGSFTDITALGHLGICGFNMGVGYEDYHGPWAKANMSDCARQVVKLLRFYELYHEVAMPWKPRPVAAVQPVTYPAGNYEDYNWYTRQRGNGFGYGYNNGRGTGRFKQGDKAVVLEPHELAGVVVTITSTYPTLEWRGVGKDRHSTERWWAKFSDPKRPTAESYQGFDDTQLGKWDDPDEVVPPEGEPAPKDAVGLVIEGRSVPEREVRIINEVWYGGKANGRHELSASILRIRNMADGLLTENKTWEARWDYEMWLFGETLLRHYSSEDSNGWQDQTFFYRDRVKTPDGNGMVVCTSPIIVTGYEDMYWVRLERKDRHGFGCQLYPDSEMTIVVIFGQRELAVSERGQPIHMPPRQLPMPASPEDTQPIQPVRGGTDAA